MNNTLTRLKALLLMPFQALYSGKFYLSVLQMRGMGFTYLLYLSLFLAIPASYKVYTTAQLFRSYDVPSLVAQIPPSYIDKNGVLSVKDNGPEQLIISNSKGQPVLAYNPGDKALPAGQNNLPLEITSRNLLIRTDMESVAIPWSSIFSTGANFEPYQSARTLDEILNSSPLAFWPAVGVYFFLMLLMNIVFAAAIIKIFFLMSMRVNLLVPQAMRLAVFGSTLCGFLLLLQFYVYVPIPFALQILLPVFYAYIALREYARYMAQQSVAGADRARAAAQQHSASGTQGQNQTQQPQGQQSQQNQKPRQDDDSDNGQGGSFAA